MNNFYDLNNDLSLPFRFILFANSINQSEKKFYFCKNKNPFQYNYLKNSHKISDYKNEELFDFFVETNDMAYFGELYKRYIPKIYGLCLKYLGEAETSKDAVMDIYNLVSIKIRNYEIENLNSWLYSVAKNYCLQVIRKEKRTIIVNIEDTVVENDTFFTHTDEAHSEEEIAALEYCLKTLSDEQQKSVKLFYFEEKSYADIVEITGYALSKVKSYIQNGKRNLKSCILNILK